MGLRISSRYVCAFKLPSIKCNCVRCPQLMPAPYHNPTPTMGHSVDFDILISANCSLTRHYTCGLQLWSPLDVLPNPLKRWRQLMVEKLTFNSLATALEDIPAVSMPITRSLKTWDICGIVLCDKTTHFSGLLLSPSTRWSCCLIIFLICHTCQVDGLSWQRRNAF